MMLSRDEVRTALDRYGRRVAPSWCEGPSPDRAEPGASYRCAVGEEVYVRGQCLAGTLDEGERAAARQGAVASTVPAHVGGLGRRGGEGSDVNPRSRRTFDCMFLGETECGDPNTRLMCPEGSRTRGWHGRGWHGMGWHGRAALEGVHGRAALEGIRGRAALMEGRRGRAGMEGRH